jgi:pimeloyl-ACP methyl ester carboxylesterase
LFGSTASGIPAFDVDHPTRNLIVEGVGEGKGQLVMTFYKDDDTTLIGVGGGVWLDIKNIKKMYERYKAMPEGLTPPYQNSIGQFNSSRAQKNEMGQPFDKPSDETKDCLIFVHGWNTDQNDAANTAETMYKRLWTQGFKGHLVAFRWDATTQSASAPAGEYNRGESRAFVYGAALKQLGSILAGQYTVSVLAHSMGNIVVGEAMLQGMQVKNYIMMEAAVPASCYDSGATALPRLVDRDAQVPTPDLHDSSLGYRGYLQNIGGTITRYYNPADFALATGFSGPLESNWEANQLNYKPDGAYIQQGWRYSYIPANPTAQRGWLLNDALGSNFSRYVTDSYEMKSFIACSRTRAVGSIESIGGPIESSINLQSAYGFGNTRPDHSGQFTRRIQQVFTLYHEIYTKSKE